MSDTSEPWPDYCSVPALFEYALQEFGLVPLDRRDAAVAFGVAAPGHASNDWGLPVADSVVPPGVDRDRLLLEWRLGVAPYFDVLDFEFNLEASHGATPVQRWITEVLREWPFVGIGVDIDYLKGNDAWSPTQVLRIVTLNATVTTLVDPLLPSLNAVQVPTQRLVDAMRWRTEGLWQLRPRGVALNDAAL